MHIPVIDATSGIFSLAVISRVYGHKGEKEPHLSADHIHVYGLVQVSMYTAVRAVTVGLPYRCTPKNNTLNFFNSHIFVI
jgi:hypothetical protein